MTQKQLKEQRKLLYNSNQDKYNKAVVVTYGGLLALIDYIEEANLVMLIHYLISCTVFINSI